METKKDKPAKKSRQFTIRLNRKFFVVIVLIAAVLAAGYLGIDAYNGYMIGSANAYYRAGLQDGFAAAIQDILQKSDNCNPVPLFYGNFTRSLVDVNCLPSSGQ